MQNNTTLIGGLIGVLISLALIYWGYTRLQKGHTFWAIVLIALGITTIGGIYVKI